MKTKIAWIYACNIYFYLYRYGSAEQLHLQIANAPIIITILKKKLEIFNQILVTFFSWSDKISENSKYALVSKYQIENSSKYLIV